MRGALAVAAILIAFATPARAEVKSSTPNGFALESRVIVPAPAASAFAALGEVGRWWDPAHTYSGSAANMTMGLHAGACFCERIPPDQGTIEHGRVVYSRPGSTLRVHGSLGPLQAEGVSGALTWTLKEVAGGTEVSQVYVVGGYFRSGAEALAPLVDRVMTTQLQRYRDHVARRN